MFRQTDNSGEFTVVKNKIKTNFGKNKNQQTKHVHVQQLFGTYLSLNNLNDEERKWQLKRQMTK